MKKDNKGRLWGTRVSKQNDSVPRARLRRERFKFTGKGAEYFGIIFVNNFLNMITLWFYSPWAKIRSLQYLYGNTNLAGSIFRFTANPWRMLRSRIIAVALLLLFLVADFLAADGENVAANYVYFGLIALYFLFAPVLAVYVLSFRFRYSEWRSIPFGFNKDFRQAYRVYFLPLLSLALVLGSLSLPSMHEQVGAALGMDLTVEVERGPAPQDAFEQESAPAGEGDAADGAAAGVPEGPLLEPHPMLWMPAGVAILLFLLLLPYFDFINMRFLVGNVRLGAARLLFLAASRDFYAIYFRYVFTLLLPLLAVLGAAAVLGGTGPSVMLAAAGLLLVFPLTSAYFKSKRYNIMLNSAQFVDHRHRLVAGVPVAGMLWISVSNTVAILLSLGLLIPWARVRTVRFMLKHTELLAMGSLDDFAARRDGESDPLAEEVADVFDLDLIG